jgi:acetylornithine/N-succinyldiaminopimelate aminotransferase
MSAPTDITSNPIDPSLAIQKEHLMPITPRPAICFVEGKGDYLYDQSGKAYLDLVQGWAVNTLGHSPTVIQQALLEQSAQLINPGPAFFNKPMINLAATLCSHSVFDQVFFANSGAEANEGAIKLARKWGQFHKSGAFKIITFQQGFHGRTLATMSATGKDTFAPLFEPKVDGFIKVPFNQLDATEQAIDKQTVAIMLELIQGEAGVIPADPDFVKGVEALCKKHNLLLIIDEVQTGIARTGSLFAYEQFQIQPDIMTLGKGLGGGVPISALLAKKHACCFEYGDQGGTFNGNPLMCASANAVLSTVLSPEFLPHINSVSEYFQQQLHTLSVTFGLGEVRGKGLLLALDTPHHSAPLIVKKALALGVLLNAPRENTLRFMPALNISHAEIDLGLACLTRILNDTQQAASC